MEWLKIQFILALAVSLTLVLAILNAIRKMLRENPNLEVNINMLGHQINIKKNPTQQVKEKIPAAEE